MDERNVRYPAGPNGEGSTHRVGLTRHCLTSGLVQLPFALRNSLPEGALLVHDVQRDEQIDVAFVPPRQLTGLTDFFGAHELQVNDEIELRITPGEPPHVRLLPVRRSRPSADGAVSDADDADAPNGAPPRPAPRRSASVWHSYRDAPLPERSTEPGAEPAAEPASERVASDVVGRDGAFGSTREPQDTPADARADVETPPSPRAPRPTPPPPTAADPDVVERFGSVTVRRLGTGRFTQPSPSDLADDVPARPRSDAAAMETEDDAPDPVLGIDPDAALATAPDVARPFEAPAGTTGDAPEALHDDAPRVHGHEPDGEPPEAADDPVRQASLFDAAPAPETRPAPTRRSAPAPRSAPTPRAQPTRRVAPEPRRPDPRPASAPPEAAAPTATPGTSDATPAAGTPDPAAAQRAREEALSRAGDLRSRIIRWMLAPDTPVIVSIELVQDTFALEADVARDVVDGILESPPPSLRLTRLRPDLLRVARITVEQNA